MRQTQEHPKPPADAFEDVTKALSAIGTLTHTDPGTFSARGKTRYGLQGVKIRVSVVPAGITSTVVAEAESDDVWDAGGKSAVSRFFETLKHADDPAFETRKNGLTPLQTFLGVVVFLILLVGIMPLTDIGGGDTTESKRHYTPERFGWELGTMLLSKATRDGGTTAMYFFGQSCRTDNPTVRQYSEAEFEQFQNGLYRAYQSWKTGGIVPPPE